MAEVLIVSGAGAYADRWHPFAETSARLADIVAASGHAVSISEEVEPALADLRGVDLTIVNIGCPRPERPAEALDPVTVGLISHLASGGGLLGIHVSSTSLTTMPSWPAMLGGRWVRGRSMHPPQDMAHVHLTAAPHPILTNLTDFDVLDERYSYLELEPNVVVLGEHVDDGRRHHPILWAHHHLGGRVVYDALGHDTRSYDSAGHVRLVERSIAWLLENSESRPTAEKVTDGSPPGTLEP
jgi:uncharacterized protein